MHLGGREHDSVIELGVGDGNSSVNRPRLLDQVVNKRVRHSMASKKMAFSILQEEGREGAVPPAFG
jgi:hypothetical protein